MILYNVHSKRMDLSHCRSTQLIAMPGTHAHVDLFIEWRNHTDCQPAPNHHSLEEESESRRHSRRHQCCSIQSNRQVEQLVIVYMHQARPNHLRDIPTYTNGDSLLVFPDHIEQSKYYGVHCTSHELPLIPRAGDSISPWE